jgi:hypothetical protein
MREPLRDDFTRIRPEGRSRAHPSIDEVVETTDLNREAFGPQATRFWSRSANGGDQGVRKLASHRVGSTPRCRRDVAHARREAVAKAGARHATRKLMAPPLRFFVLPAFLSLGNRCTGLPPRYPPLSRFLTFSAASSCPSLATLFRAASALRISGLQSFPRPASRDTSRCPLLLCCFIQLRLGVVSLSAPLPQPSFVRLAASQRCSVP